MNFKRFLLIASTTSLLLAGQAYGHAMLEHSSPENNAVLNVTPKSIDLTFGHPTKLVLFKLMKGKDVVPVTVDTTAAASKTFSIPLPVLTSGQYQATWSTLSADGHPMKGVISFTITGK